MAIVTRFNPTSNGPLHLGHVYALLINERLAHADNGRFLVRFDDSWWPYHDGTIQTAERTAALVEQQRVDIEWLGLRVDGWYSQHAMLPEVRAWLAARGFEFARDNRFPPVPLFLSQPANWAAYPYTPVQTPERVVMDAQMGATHLLRGEELATEYGLYCHWCDVLKLPWPVFVFLPRLQGLRGDISKTNGGYTVTELRAQGWTAEEVLRLVERAALRHPGNGWNILNLQPQPRVQL